jgi:hypothetical protein
MSGPMAAAVLSQLERNAHDASIAEENFRKEAAERVRALEQARMFGFRRLNLMRPVVNAVAGSNDSEEAQAKGEAAFLAALEWDSVNESRQDVLAHFTPVIDACWRAVGPDATAADPGEMLRALEEFEAWFAAHRNGPFLTLFEREVLELPLVEV